MRDHELELIAALVEGRLDDETEARALVDSSAEHRREYEAQKTAYEALRGLGIAELTHSERSALHRDVWTALRRDHTPARPGWYRWVPVTAGVLFVLVGLVAVLSGGGQDAGVFAETAADLDGGSETPVPEDALTRDDDGSAGEDSDEGAVVEEPTATTVTAFGSPPEEEVAAFYSDEAERIRAGEFTARMHAFDTAAEDDLDVCLETADLDGYQVVALLDPPDDIDSGAGAPVLIAVAGDTELADATVAFVDRSECRLIHLDE